MWVGWKSGDLDLIVPWKTMKPWFGVNETKWKTLFSIGLIGLGEGGGVSCVFVIVGMEEIIDHFS